MSDVERLVLAFYLEWKECRAWIWCYGRVVLFGLLESTIGTVGFGVCKCGVGMFGRVCGRVVAGRSAVITVWNEHDR